MAVSRKKNATVNNSKRITLPDLIKKGKRSAAPSKPSPMLATLTDQPFDHADWLFELKWDGYRCMAILNENNVQLRSRKNISFNNEYAAIEEALKKLKLKAVIDGEVVVLNEKGHPDFEALQNWGRSPEGHIHFYVFDIIWLNGYDLTDLPLYERKQILKKIITSDSIVRYTESIKEKGISFYELAREKELEGIIAKKKNSLYLPGKRTRDWLKMPVTKRQEFVVGGWVESDSGREFKSLLFGYYKNGKLYYFHHGGGGFKENELPATLKEFKKLEIKRSPFVNDIDYEGVFHFMKPVKVAEFKYTKLTKAGKIRHPAIFMGWRKDKDPKEITLDEPVKINDVATEEAEIKSQKSKVKTQKRQAVARRIKTDPESNWPEIEKIPVSSEQMFEFNRKEVRLCNVEKELWKGITKARLIQYYHSVADYILPHLKNRPLSLHIKHKGPMAPGLYIKDMEGRAPEWAEVFQVKRKHKKPGRRDLIDYLVCNDEATLQWVVNLGCIDINPWTSRTNSDGQPDFIIIDLDPSDDDFSKAIETAKAARSFFNKHKIMGFPKTSGKTGIHLFLPCTGFDFPKARAIAEKICHEIHLLVPEITTTNVTIEQRGNKLYIDPNQNDYADTVASAYSVRPYKLPTVSTPLEWKEINNRLDPKKFTIDTVIKRLKTKGDLFKNVLLEKNRVANAKVLKKFLG
jgi:bifunctional non-homologous end joining protein LigD